MWQKQENETRIFSPFAVGHDGVQDDVVADRWENDDSDVMKTFKKSTHETMFIKIELKIRI